MQLYCRFNEYLHPTLLNTYPENISTIVTFRKNIWANKFLYNRTSYKIVWLHLLENYWANLILLQCLLIWRDNRNGNVSKRQKFSVQFHLYFKQLSWKFPTKQYISKRGTRSIQNTKIFFQHPERLCVNLKQRICSIIQIAKQGKMIGKRKMFSFTWITHRNNMCSVLKSLNFCPNIIPISTSRRDRGSN